MTIRFAAAWGGSTPVIVRALCPSAPLSAVNDNPAPHGPRLRAARHDFASRSPQHRPLSKTLPKACNDERMLFEALRHFAKHGLSAAAHACGRAEAADADGDGSACERWLAICHQLDRRMAEAALRRIGKHG